MSLKVEELEVGAGASVLNAGNPEILASVLAGGGAEPLRSDCDEQLLISLPFASGVKLHSLNIWGGGMPACRKRHLGGTTQAATPAAWVALQRNASAAPTPVAAHGAAASLWQRTSPISRLRPRRRDGAEDGQAFHQQRPPGLRRRRGQEAAPRVRADRQGRGRRHHRPPLRQVPIRDEPDGERS
eukprot:scaffold63412_cov66-Phaeocystis_antarctica.AAC.2